MDTRTWLSRWIRLSVLIVSVGAFVLLLETQIFDSREAAPPPRPSDSAVPVPGARLTFEATAYCKGTTTASGVAVRSGIAAADPALLPIGSVVTVDASDQRYDGVYTILDTGPSVVGPSVDLYIWSCFEALRFGRRDVQVTVLRLGWNPQASATGMIEGPFRQGTSEANGPSASDETVLSSSDEQLEGGAAEAEFQERTGGVSDEAQ